MSPCGSSVKGTLRVGSLAVDPERYVGNAMETDISFHRGPVCGTWIRARITGTWREV